MNSSAMIQRVKDRTHQPDDTKIIGELNSAKDWAYGRIYNSENGPDLLMTFGVELSIASRTREYDLDANVSGTVYGLKQLWLRLPTQATFELMQKADGGDRRFVLSDSTLASDTTTETASGHPVYFQVFNFSKLRFSPAIPASSTLRADVWLLPPDIDPTVNEAQTYGSDLPQPSHEAVVDKATAQIFTNHDDSRWREWEMRAEQKLTDALRLMSRRAQGPTPTRAFRARRRYWY